MYVIKEDIPPEVQIMEWTKNDKELDINNLPEDWDYYWETNLEEELIEDSYVRRLLIESGENTEDYHKIYQPWDILLFETSNTPGTEKHKILLVSSVLRENDVKYSGYLFSSRVEKSNKENPYYSNNLYVNDYSTILEKPAGVHTPGILKLDQRLTFTDKDLFEHGCWKGHANKEFQVFVREAVNNIKNGHPELNKEKFWIK